MPFHLASIPITKTVPSNIATSKNGLVKSSKIIDYENIRWPRDALYIPYTYPEELNNKDDGGKEPYKVHLKYSNKSKIFNLAE